MFFTTASRSEAVGLGRTVERIYQRMAQTKGQGGGRAETPQREAG